jgi:YgiT-type zinc finger domain-containing protein
MYNFTCEHCNGLVRQRVVDREVLKHKGSFVVLENVPIGIREKCGARYFDASVVRRAAEIGRGTVPADRMMEIPIGRYA